MLGLSSVTEPGKEEFKARFKGGAEAMGTGHLVSLSLSGLLFNHPPNLTFHLAEFLGRFFFDSF